jgi:hypothetical protein
MRIIFFLKYRNFQLSSIAIIAIIKLLNQNCKIALRKPLFIQNFTKSYDSSKKKEKKKEKRKEKKKIFKRLYECMLRTFLYYMIRFKLDHEVLLKKKKMNESE